MNAMVDRGPKIVYWHRELPPVDAEAIGEHTLEATSGRVQDTLAHRDELWNRCYNELMDQARSRLQQEVIRLGGRYAHILNEAIDSRHDPASGETWLRGRFTYMLYGDRRLREPESSGHERPNDQTHFVSL